MKSGILSPNISDRDTLTSSMNIDELRRFVIDNRRSLIFFVGAGASNAGNTGMPTAGNLLRQILLDALERSETSDTGSSPITQAIKDISNHIGFEITLNDFWQICQTATALIYKSFAELERGCMPNFVHSFLAHWLSTGGIVVTTNYDCLIEREWQKIDRDITVRYQEEGLNSFSSWQEDLDRGGCLFKIHGSLESPASCLGALEHVGTRLIGHRANMLTEIVRQRPLCFVGWRGIDPDIPPLLADSYNTRDSALPIFWIHFEGEGSIQSAIERTTPLIKKYASSCPILTDANRACEEMLRWINVRTIVTPSSTTASLDFSEAVKQCSRTGATRFVGIVLRRAGKLNLSGQVLRIALKLAVTAEEKSAALQEMALVEQQKPNSDMKRSVSLIDQAREVLGEKPDPKMQLNADFGLLSMTIVTLRSHPWSLLKIPLLFRRYSQDIELLRRSKGDRESLALHESLLHLYLGRLRLNFFGWLAIVAPLLANWIMQPFHIARSTIDDAKDIHLHSRVDVLAYRAVALARLKRCAGLSEDIAEIERLVLILKDDAREKHWKNQRREIEQGCNKSYI